MVPARVAKQLLDSMYIKMNTDVFEDFAFEIWPAAISAFERLPGVLDSQQLATSTAMDACAACTFVRQHQHTNEKPTREHVWGAAMKESTADARTLNNSYDIAMPATIAP